MPTIYISDRGDDKNDGLSLQTPIYSLKRAMKLQGGTIIAGTSGPAHGSASKRSLPTKRKRSDATRHASSRARFFPRAAFRNIKNRIIMRICPTAGRRS